MKSYDVKYKTGNSKAPYATIRVLAHDVDEACDRARQYMGVPLTITDCREAS